MFYFLSRSFLSNEIIEPDSELTAAERAAGQAELGGNLTLYYRLYPPSYSTSLIRNPYCRPSIVSAYVSCHRDDSSSWPNGVNGDVNPTHSYHHRSLHDPIYLL